MYNLEKLNQLLIDNNIEATPDCDMTCIRIVFEADNTLSIRIYEDLINICTDDEISNGFLPNFSLLEKLTKTLQLIQECHYEEKQIDISKTHNLYYSKETSCIDKFERFWVSSPTVVPETKEQIINNYSLKKITKITIEE